MLLAVGWNGMEDGMEWKGKERKGMGWDGMGWDGMGWDGTRMMTTGRWNGR